MSTLQNQIKLVYWLFRQSNMHIYTWFLPQSSQEGNKCTTKEPNLLQARIVMYHYIREAKSLLS